MHAQSVPFFFSFTLPMIAFVIGLASGGLGGFIEGRRRNTGSAFQVVALVALFAASSLFLNTKFNFWW